METTEMPQVGDTVRRKWRDGTVSILSVLTMHSKTWSNPGGVVLREDRADGGREYSMSVDDWMARIMDGSIALVPGVHR